MIIYIYIYVPSRDPQMIAKLAYTLVGFIDITIAYYSYWGL